MSTLIVNNIKGSDGTNNVKVNGVPIKYGLVNRDNRIINGTFELWQRGTSSSLEGYHSADRWRNSFDGGTVTMSRQDFSIALKIGGNYGKHYLRQSVSGQTLSSHYAAVDQRIEDVRTYSGSTITILGWAKRSYGSGNMAVSVDQNFGTSSGISADTTVNGTGQIVDLHQNWTPFAVEVNVPSISGKTIGSDGNSKTEINFWTSAGSDYNVRTGNLGLQDIGVDLWGIHIRRGSHTIDSANFYKPFSIDYEILRSRRYYEKSYEAETSVGTSTFLGASYYTYNTSLVNTVGIQAFFEVTKLLVPQVTVYNPVTGASGSMRTTTGLNLSTTIRRLDRDKVLITNSGANAGVKMVFAHWEADSEI